MSRPLVHKKGEYDNDTDNRLAVRTLGHQVTIKKVIMLRHESGENVFLQCSYVHLSTCAKKLAT